MKRRTVLAAGAWVVPTIMTAAPSAASVSLPPETIAAATGASGVSGVSGAGAPPAPRSAPLAFTGDDLERDTILGGALIAGGWVIQHWSARKTPEGRDG